MEDNNNETTEEVEETTEDNKVEETTTEDNKDNELSEREKALDEREKALKEQELEMKLQEQGLDKNLIKYIKFNNVEDVDKYIAEVKKVVQAQQSYVPKDHKSKNTSITKEQFNKMTYTERVNLYNSNKTLYMSLCK